MKTQTAGRVLYAEDEFSNRELVKIKLESAGIACDVVENGLEAVKKCKDNSYDVIILDQYMPLLNGIETAMQIRSFLPSTYFIGVTSDDEMTNTLKQSGFDDVFIKPIKGSAFVDKVKSYIA